MALTMHWGPDATVDHLLDIFERVNREVPIAPLRWSIAHLNDASEASLQRMSALGVGWTVQDAMYFGGDDLVRRQGPDAGGAFRRSSRATGSASRSAPAPTRIASRRTTRSRRSSGSSTARRSPARRFAARRRRRAGCTRCGSTRWAARGSRSTTTCAARSRSASSPTSPCCRQDYLDRAGRRGRRPRVGADAARRQSRLRRRRVRGARDRRKGMATPHRSRAALPLRRGARRARARDAEHGQSLLLLLRRLPSVRAFPRSSRRRARRVRRHGDHADVACERRVHGRRRQDRRHAADAKGLMRWYASCCNTPIGNTMATSAMPFIGLIHACIDAPTGALGPIRGRAFARARRAAPSRCRRTACRRSSWSRACSRS